MLAWIVWRWPATDWNPNETTLVAGSDALDPQNFKYEYGTSDLDVRHEASGMVDPHRQSSISAALPKALGLILRALAVAKDENSRGGWRYQPGSRDSDTSCSGWALMALRSAKLNGAAIPDAAIRAACCWSARSS